MTNDIPPQVWAAARACGAQSLERFPGPPEALYHFLVPGPDAERCWQSLRARVSTTGHWPVILGSEDSRDRTLKDLTGRWVEDMRVDSMLARAVEIDAVEWLREALRELEQPAEDEEPWDPAVQGSYIPRGPWPNDLPSSTLGVPRDYKTNQPYEQVAIALVPTTASWQVPAYLRFGWFNSCPHPEVHVGIMKRWEKQYGAEIICMSHDVIETIVARPPTDRDAALALAFEQFAYCEDIVSQGTVTVDALAATLLNGRLWYFWWD